MRVLAIANHKGGVGKTTTSIHLAHYLAEVGYRVLLIDLDSTSAATSHYLSASQFDSSHTIYQALKDPAVVKISDIAIGIEENLDFVPSTEELHDIESNGRADRAHLLQQVLRHADYDRVILDGPPSMGAVTKMMLVAATDVIVPARLERLDMRAIGFVINAMEKEVKPILNPELGEPLILPTMWSYQKRTLHNIGLEKLRDTYGDRVFDSCIPDKMSFGEFHHVGHGEPIDSPEYKKLAELYQ